MVKVKRANKVLRIPDEQIDEYLAKGFDVIGADGTVEIASVPNDVNVLKQAYTDHTAKIAELEDEIKKLKAKKTTIKKTTAKKSEE